MKTHHLHRAEVVLNRPSTQTEVEVEVMVQAKDEAVIMATIIKIGSSSISQMIHRDRIHLDVEIIEAGGVKGVAEISKETMQEMIAENCGIVEEQVIFRMIVHQRTKVT